MIKPWYCSLSWARWIHSVLCPLLRTILNLTKLCLVLSNDFCSGCEWKACVYFLFVCVHAHMRVTWPSHSHVWQRVQMMKFLTLNFSKPATSACIQIISLSNVLDTVNCSTSSVVPVSSPKSRICALCVLPLIQETKFVPICNSR